MSVLKFLRKSQPAALYCSFCRKPDNEVGTLIKADGPAAICDGCVEVCGQVVKEKEYKENYERLREFGP